MQCTEKIQYNKMSILIWRISRFSRLTSKNKYWYKQLLKFFAFFFYNTVN